MKLKGFIGNLLNIDLSNNKITQEPLNYDIAGKFLGAAGYCVRYLYDHLDKDTDPLSPQNILMFMTGPLCGSNAPTSGRFNICAKSPYTGLWGESSCGGFFGPELKKAGFDGIIIRGKSKSPVFLEITDEGTEIKDAAHLWGKGIFETSRILKNQYGPELVRVACIGQAGENLIKFATIASEEKAAGRTGMGAVMGSKNLKAVVVKGKKKSYETADPNGFKDAVKAAIENVQASFATQMFGLLGTAGGVDKFNLEGELPIKYWTLGTWEGAYHISGATASEKIFTRNYPCFSCPIGCAKKARVKEGKYKTDGEVEAPEYETIAGFGSLILNDNLESIVIANETCNDFGIDTISCSSTIALIYYLFNENKITSEQIDGLNPKWGDIEPALEMIRKIAFREGIGNILADGSNNVGKQFNIPSDQIATTLGMEIPYHDLRQTYGMAIAYSVGAPRGPCHTACDMYMVLLGLPFEELGIKMIDRYDDGEDMARNCALTYDYRALYNALTMCIFCNPLPSMVLNMLNAATGLNLDLNELKIMAERIYMMKRLFNLKMGLTPKMETLPKIVLQPVKEGGSAGRTPNFEQLKRKYYEIRTFDPETGYPSQEKLRSLGLEDLVKF